jgi:hypothetical protein
MPGDSVSDDDLAGYVFNNLAVYGHPTSTVPMGGEEVPWSVVDSVGAVQGIERLRVIASASGSQLGPLVSGAGHVILVIGGQKIVSDIGTGLRRIYEYCSPLEDRRAREAYGVPSGVNNVLIINRTITPSLR